MNWQIFKLKSDGTINTWLSCQKADTPEEALRITQTVHPRITPEGRYLVLLAGTADFEFGSLASTYNQRGAVLNLRIGGVTIEGAF